MQPADLHNYGAMEEGEKSFIQVKGFGIDFDVRIALHYTVIIIKRKPLYFIFIRMFNYLSNCYFETKNNAFQVGCFYPAFACTSVCIYVSCCMCMFFLFAWGCISCPGQTPEKACMYYVLCCYIFCSHAHSLKTYKKWTKTAGNGLCAI